MTGSMLWYDYETFGTDARRDRAVQFAAVRTDLDFNPIEAPIDILCQPALDTIPDPMACSITGISPIKAQQQGLPEFQFAQRIHHAMMQPGTCTLGYNSIRFDDEVGRFLFYRNLLDPYEREWRHNNSRWDLLDVVRLTYGFRPEGLQWPTDVQGKTSFRLELLTAANGIVHQNAHDAVSDVLATIEMGKLIQQRQPELYHYAFNLRRKSEVQKHIQLLDRKPFVNVSGMFPVEQGCMGVLAPIALHPTNRNEVICFNLAQDPDILQNLTSEEIQQRLYTPRDQLPPGVERIGLKSVHINKCPMIVPAKMLTPALAEKFGHDLPSLRRHGDKLKAFVGIESKILSVFEGRPEQELDPDIALYQGFIADGDKAKLQQLQYQRPDETLNIAFDDPRLPELVFRFRARNFPEQLNDQDQIRWLQHCHQIMTRSDFGCPRTLAQAEQQLAELSHQQPQKQALWADLLTHYQNLRDRLGVSA